MTSYLNNVEIAHAQGIINATAQDGNTTTFVSTDLTKLSALEAAKYANGTAVINGYEVNVTSIDPSTGTLTFQAVTGLTVAAGYEATIIKPSGGSYSSGGGSEPSVSFTRPDNSTPYVIDHIVGTSPASSLEFTNVSTEAGANIIITGATLIINVGSIPTGMTSGFTLYLFDSAPTAVADNLAYSIQPSEAAHYLCSIDLPLPTDMGNVLVSIVDNLVIKRKLAQGSTSLFTLVTTKSAYTPTPQAVKTITLHVVGV